METLPQGCYRIEPNLVAGPYPEGNRLVALLRLQVDLFIDLTEAGELEPYEDSLPPGCEHHRMSVPDYSVPTVQQMAEILEILTSALHAGRKVYLHCWGGIGRTGTVAGCHLVQNGLAGPEALAAIRRLRLAHDCDPNSPETEVQRAMVLHWGEDA